MTAPLRTLLVDDEPLAIERLQILCAQMDGVQLVGTRGNDAHLLRVADWMMREHAQKSSA